MKSKNGKLELIIEMCEKCSNLWLHSIGTKIGLIQLHVTDDKKANLRNAYKFLQIAKTNNCEIAILPECFNCPYGVGKFFSFFFR